MTRTRPPSAFAGMFVLNFAFTTPLGPWGRATRPQITFAFEPSVAFFVCNTAAK